MYRASQTSRVAVLLGDPRLPYSYNLSHRFEENDYRAVERLQEALAQVADHEFYFLDHHARFHEQLTELVPDLVLNFCNTGLGNNVSRQLHVAAMLEALALPFVGAGPECMALCHDKGMALEVAATLGVPVPEQRYCRLSADRLPHIERYPVLLKPNAGDGSIGMEADAVVYSSDDLARCVDRLCTDFDRPAVLIQEFLPGAEYSVGLIGNPGAELTCLPPLEVDYGDLDADLPPIMTYASKVDPASRYWEAIRLKRAALSDPDRDAIHDHCRAVFERLGCRDYARFDFRCDAEGHARLIDVNAHPMWADGGMMATMAGFAGYDYSAMLAHYLASACRREHLR